MPKTTHLSLLTTLLFGVVSPLSLTTGISGSHKVQDPTPMTMTTTATSSRRGFLTAVAAGIGTALVSQTCRPVSAVSDEEITIYMGCGCFWHVQETFVQAERKLLSRTNDFDITARAGYAGGKAGAKNGKVCYHNAAQISDYGSLGHAEVVQLRIPSSKFGDFVTEYFNLFTDQGYRPDQFQDRGPEYRNLVGIPGGAAGPYSKLLIEASQKAGDKLDFARGKGDDPDRRGLVFVMDTAEFPFFVAEQYHQFHDGFNLGENYPNSYNNIANKLAKGNVLEQSECPNGLIGIGAFGL